MKNVITILFRKQKQLLGEEYQKTNDAFLLCFVINFEDPASYQIIADAIWKKLIKEESKFMKECFLPEQTAKEKYSFDPEQIVIAGKHEYDIILLASLIREKIKEAEKAHKTIMEIITNN